MRNTLILLGLLTILAIIFFVFIYDRDQSSLSLEETRFAIEDTSAIHQIVLTRMVRGNPEFRIQLDRQADESWMLNERYSALLPKVQKLLNILHLIQVKEVLTGEGLVSAEAILRSVHTLVEVSDKKGKTIKSFLLGTQTKDARGSLVKLSDAQTPYIAEMPGFQGYINAYFPVDEMNWRENLLFQAQLPDIQQIVVSYADPAQSFALSRSVRGSSWQLLGLEQSPDSAHLAAYLSHFQGKIYAESFAQADYPGKRDQLQAQPPEVEIVIGYFSGERRAIHLFERQENLNNFFGWVNDGELLTVQHFVIDRFLQTRSYLLGQDQTNPNLP
ncbi:MAG: hypothetical protein AAF587_18000 [Bacteroidota bacterium]